MTTPPETTADAPAADPVPPTVQTNLVKPTAPVIGRVISNELCTASKKAAGWVRHVSIDVSGTPLEGATRSGQAFGILPPGEDDRGKPHKLRLYSLSSPSAGEDGEGKVISTTVKRLIDEHWETGDLYTGVCSNYVCGLKPGDEVRVTGPSGKRFVLPEDVNAHDYVFFATGTGIAPFRGMITDLLAANAPSKFALVMGAPYATDLLYHDWLTELDEKHDNFRYLPALSREINADGTAKMYVQGRISADPLGSGPGSLADMLSSPRTVVFVCGIAGMELGIFQEMARALPREASDMYFTIDAEAGEPDGWNRRMISRQIKPTRRMLLEVY